MINIINEWLIGLIPLALHLSVFVSYVVFTYKLATAAEKRRRK